MQRNTKFIGSLIPRGVDRMDGATAARDTTRAYPEAADGRRTHRVPPALWAQVVWKAIYFIFPLPLGKGFTHPPYPFPRVWRGEAAGNCSIQDGLEWLQEGLREPKMTPTMAQDSHRCLKIVSNVP